MLIRRTYKLHKNIKASIKIQGNILTLNFKLTTNTLAYNFPKKETQTRAHELWKNTCFELFLASKDKTHYYEINLSPSTKWNIYYFTDYKTNMQEFKLKKAPKITTSQTKKSFILNCKMKLNGEILKKEIQINLATILLHKKIRREFYSIKKRKIIDFHDKSGFVKL